jgi:hypothetical protein
VGGREDGEEGWEESSPQISSSMAEGVSGGVRADSTVAGEVIKSESIATVRG